MERSYSTTTLDRERSPYVEDEQVPNTSGFRKHLWKGIGIAIIIVIVIVICVYVLKVMKVYVEKTITNSTTQQPMMAPQLDCSQTTGPYPLDCLRQWWKSAGCTSPLGTGGQTKYWDGLPVDSVKADMTAFATLQDQPHVNWCHVEAPL